MYVDDITLLIPGANKIEVTQTANKVLDSISSWLTSHKLTLNISNTKYMIFSPQPHKLKEKFGMQIKIKESVADKVTNFNRLGLHIQNNLGWKSHMLTIISKLRICCDVIHRIRLSTNVSCLLALYHALATNYINYCITTWHAGNAVLLNQIQKQCNKIVRSIFHRDKFSKVDDVYRNYDILQVNDLLKFHVACFMYKHVHNQLPPCFENIFLQTCNIRSCQTRQSNNLYLPLYKKSVCQQTISFFGVKIWKDLPQTIRSVLHKIQNHKKKLT